MQVQSAPVLIVILNNTCYNATKRPLVAAYPEGYSVREDRFVGVDLLPAPRYDRLAGRAAAGPAPRTGAGARRADGDRGRAAGASVMGGIRDSEFVA
jgi:hypothetical protein